MFDLDDKQVIYTCKTMSANFFSYKKDKTLLQKLFVDHVKHAFII